MELLSLQIKEHCENLDNGGKQELYEQVLKEAKDAAENHNIDKLKKLSEIAVAVEEVSERELLEPFDDKNPLREANIAVERNGTTNYLFSLSDSSKLYDLRENTEEALYQAIKSDDVELVKHLLIVLLPEKMNKADLSCLKDILLKSYEELNLSDDMKNYLEKKIRFYSFLYGFKSNKNPIELFINQLEVDYEIDKFLLSLIVERVENKRLLSEIDNMIELLKKYERFDELEYKVRRLKSELESGKGKYLPEAILASIKEREKEMREIEINPTDLVIKRKRLAEQLMQKVQRQK